MAFDIYEFLNKNKFELGTVKKEVGNTPFKGGNNDIRKTNYDVSIVDGKLDLNTHKTVLAENTQIINEGVDTPIISGFSGLIDFHGLEFVIEDVIELNDYFKGSTKIKMVKQFVVEPTVFIHDKLSNQNHYFTKGEIDKLYKFAMKNKKIVANREDFK